ncbi:MAG: GAF domain-containing protein, partial [Anaerolineae bacterium]|nr:GAF domain-containing protein [Anaerolineae bacterium]
SDDGTKVGITHEWCAAGIEPRIDKLDEMPIEDFAWCMERINRLEIIHIPRVADLPPEASAEKEILQAQDIQSLIIVPMVYGGSLVGYLGFDAVGAKKAWAENTIVLIKIVGEIFANALERKRAEEELGRRNEELAALCKTGQAIPSTLDLDAVLTLVMAEARSMLNAGATSVLLHEPASDELCFAAVAGAGSEMLIGTHLPAGVGIAGLVMQTGQPMLITDAQSDPRFYDRIDTITGLTTHSLLVVPLLSKGKVIGVIEAVNRTGRAFDQHALELLSTLAGSAAIAIENARLYEETARRLAETRALQEVTLAAASTLDFDQALTRAIQAIHRTLGIEYLSFLLPDESEEYLIAHPSLIGFAPPSEEGLHIPLDRSVSGRVYTTGQPELIDDVTQTSSYFRCTPGLRSELAVPVRVGEHVVAVLNAESTQPAAFSEDDLRTVQAIAAQLGIMMENARLYEAEREQRKLVEQSQLQLVQSEKLAATGRLAASLAHEINNPLQAIHNSLQLMLTFALNAEEQEEYLQMADEEVERLISMATHILEFARRPQREMRLTRLNEVVEKVLALTSKYLQHRHIILRQDLSPDAPAVLATPDELGQVFLNLVLNAVDAMPEGGTLNISSHLAENERLAVAFSDTGNGIPPEYLNRIFEPFFSTREEGTGLGLTISYNVVERHGGEITVQSVMGEGTTFTVWLPALPAQSVKRNV